MKKLLLLAIILITFACNDKDDSEDSQDIYLLKKSYINDELYRDYIYSSDSILIRTNRYRADTINVYTKYEYFGNTIRSNYHQSNGDLTRYRDNIQLSEDTVKFNTYFYGGTLENYSFYSFEDSDCGYSKYEFFLGGGIYAEGSEIVFTDDNCSNSKTNYDENSDIKSTSQTTRDNKSVYTHSSLDDLLQINNLGSVTDYKFWDQDGNLKEDYSYTAVIEYNNSGYPTLITRTYLDGEITVFTYEY